MTPQRYLIRAIGFFLVVLGLVVITYPILNQATKSGKQIYLNKPMNAEEYKQLQSEHGFLTILPVRLFVSQVYRNCLKEMDSLCQEVGGSANSFDGAKCLVEKQAEIQTASCRKLFETPE